MSFRPRVRPRVIAAGRVIAADRDLVPGVVEIIGGRIVKVREGTARRADLTARDGILAPGLIDLQINGAAGVDFLTCDRARDLDRVHRYLLSTGVTGYLATLISAPLVRLRAALVNWQRFAAASQAPRVLGVHLEGPYLSAKFAGAHDPADLRTPDAGEFDTLLDMVPRLVKLVTLAPELPGADRVIRAAARRSLAVSAGHTGATYEQACAAFAAGVRMVTHLFNAMRPVHHRDPGIVPAALEDSKVTVSLIADLIHVHPAMLRLAINAKGFAHVALVSDAVAAAGTAVASAKLGRRPVMITDAPRLPAGTLAGANVGLDQAVRNVAALGLPLREAVLMASAVPAAVLRRRDLGRIAPGARADFVLFDPKLRVTATYVEGTQAFARRR